MLHSLYHKHVHACTFCSFYCAKRVVVNIRAKFSQAVAKFYMGGRGDECPLALPSQMVVALALQEIFAFRIYYSAIKSI